MPLIPAHRRQRQVNLCEFEASLGYRVSSRTGYKATQRNLVSKIKKKKKKTKTAAHTNAAHLYIVNLFATQRNAIHLYIDKYSIPQHQIDLQLPIAKEEKTSR